MWNNQLIRVFVFIATLIFLFLILFCCQGVVNTTSGDENTIEINFPLSKKCIYATAIYIENNNILELLVLNILSMQFDNSYTLNDTLFLDGDVEYYYSINSEYSGTVTYREMGDILISMDDKWILYQSSNIEVAYQMFMKISRNTKSIIDTTLVPTRLYNQFPVYPKKIKPDHKYSILRPGNVNGEFVSVFRCFQSHDIVNWNDIYGNGQGIFIEIDHSLEFFSNDPIKYYVIIDKHGIIISQESFEAAIISPSNPDGYEARPAYQITRRILDFTDPQHTNDISYYSDDVKEKGLKIIDVNNFK